MAGGFANTASGATVEIHDGAAWLYAKCSTGQAKGSGSEKDGFNRGWIRLDDKIGNEIGKLTYNKVAFSETSTDIKLLEDGRTLQAKCQTGTGGTPTTSTINLDEHIRNIYGNLQWV